MTVNEVTGQRRADRKGSAARTRVADAVLRRILIGSDLVAVVLAWTLALQLTVARDAGYGTGRVALWAAAAGVLTVFVLAREQLYLTRVWAIRALELHRVGRGSLLAAVLLLGVDAVLTGPPTVSAAMLAAVLAGALILASRSTLVVWMHAAPAADDSHRSLLLVADIDADARVIDLLDGHQRLGYQLVGLVSHRRPSTVGSVPWVGTPADLPVLVRLTAADSVVVAGDAFTPAELEGMLERLIPLDVHTHLVTTDAADVPHVRVLPLAHGSVVPRSDPSLSTPQRIAKRIFDLLAGAVLALAALPVLLVAVTLLKLTAGGPVLVRDRCLGPRGEPVAVLRLRTVRSPGPSLATRVGETCRRLGIDQLPQLGNVLAGSMTLVGPSPRPRHRDRRASTSIDVNAGMVGLRHVETPDYPELGDHRRADEFYVENWSIGLDLSILAACASDVLWRAVRRVVRVHGDGAAAA